MLRVSLVIMLCLGLQNGILAQAKGPKKSAPFAEYVTNRAPLKPNPYIELPLGSIRPQGWLKEMLLRQKTGASGRLDELYPLVMGKRNGWLGGDGDQWERGPYWIDGLLPLAYILNDPELIAKVKPWVEWAINSQQPNGYFGPLTDYPQEAGVQRNNCQDWWPKMVMLKILKQYYSATQDQRVINLMTNYFKYQLRELPKHPLDHWTFWARYRGGDNLMVVYWLYNHTGDAFLLQLADLLHKQTFDYTNSFLNTSLLSQQGSIHCVNLAQGFKEPLIYYQQHPDQKYVKAVDKGLADLRHFNGMAHGLYGGDEALHGNNPTQGSELCSAVEMMFSLESMLNITGRVAYADQLEKIAFNALPAQVTDDFMGRQYFQQANQVMLTRHVRNFDQNHGGTDVCMGLLTGYPCCTSNMHQGWPKFTQNLWYATPDKGLAALVFSPSEVSANVAGGNAVTFTEETNYPFDETIKFTLTTDKRAASLAFPFHMRIPAWCTKATITINGSVLKETAGNQIVTVNRSWKSGDVVELHLPMHVMRNTWYENSVSIERGPLTYALKMEEETKTVKNDRDPINYGNEYTEVRSLSPWNFGLVAVPEDKLEKAVNVIQKRAVAAFPWNPTNAPSEIRVKARRIPSWQLYNDMTGPIPYSLTNGLETEKEEEVTLIPYGCTTLRISQFPLVR
ncbi:beta-L-arabinofuranosidase domain-containing protein [Spirosoma sp.]|uniref:beta-L-arabinofuranosidase domain-containing protein n=1 Tax=Spirosoma sp. TaxID=1899569 RepID=UPI002635FBF3|nr:beta-L-arabinofuranosidase domain-containing protein [Spirosoma sp.]MCX6216292.1 glycoside hydrolase family 127 protein [Spirosoma sp.]